MSLTLRDVLQDIYDRNGKLTAELVLKEATAKNHPLHHRFEWNNRQAAEEHRLGQAARLIRSVKLVYREATELEDAGTVRMYHAVRTPEGNSYVPAETIVEDPFLRQLTLNEMERDWKTLRRRYEHFAEFADMVLGDLGEDVA